MRERPLLVLTGLTPGKLSLLVALGRKTGAEHGHPVEQPGLELLPQVTYDVL